MKLRDSSTFFQNSDGWPMHDNADPLSGWSSKEVEATSSGPATADVYGKLFYYIREQLRAFLTRLSDLPVSFELFQMDVADLGDNLTRGLFSRIEVRSILPRYMTIIEPWECLTADPFNEGL